MTLDDLQKVSSILFSGIGSLVLGYFTVTGKWNEFTLKEEQFCIDTESYYTQAALRSDMAPPLRLLDRIKDRCGFASLDEARLAFQSEKAGLAQITSEASFDVVEPIIVGDPSLESGEIDLTPSDGWVVVASFDASGADSNFTQAGSDTPAVIDMTPPEPGTKLVAKWPVNLRQNTNKTSQGANPSLSILDTGMCVDVSGESITQRSVIWTPVRYSDCTTGG